MMPCGAGPGSDLHLPFNLDRVPQRNSFGEPASLILGSVPGDYPARSGTSLMTTRRSPKRISLPCTGS